LLCHPLSTAFPSLSLHDALPISLRRKRIPACLERVRESAPKLVDDVRPRDQVVRERQLPDLRVVERLALSCVEAAGRAGGVQVRSEEHTSELQSLTNLVCRLLLD